MLVAGEDLGTGPGVDLATRRRTCGCRRRLLQSAARAVEVELGGGEVVEADGVVRAARGTAATQRTKPV